MKKAASFLVEKRWIILSAFLVLAAASLFLVGRVKINHDMTVYLPEDSGMKQGLELMNGEFGQAVSSDLRVMMPDLSGEEKEEVYRWLSELEPVSAVNWDSGETYNKGNYTLYELSLNYDSHSEEAASVFRAVHEKYDDQGVATGGSIDDANVPLLPFRIVVLSFLLIIFVLLVMCNSWFEPVVFLMNIGIAIVINLGTNVILGSISEYTYSMIALMQLVLSMDYSIILLNRYTQEKEKGSGNLSAMKAAIAAAFPAIMGSSLTTFAGLLSLAFMSFRIGADMGIAMAKSVVISLLCIFTVLPALILLSDKWIEKTRKKALHISMKGYSRLAFKGRFAFIILFAALFIGVFFLRNNTEIQYMLETDNKVDAVFEKKNSLVLLYEKKDGDKIGQVLAEFENDERILDCTGYYNTLGKECRAEEITDLFGSSDALDPSLIRIVYTDRFADLSAVKVNVRELLTFVRDKAKSGILPLETDEETLNQLDILIRLQNILPVGGTELTVKEFAERFGLWSDMLDENTASLLYLYYVSENAYDESWTMTPAELIGYISEKLLNDARFASFITDEVRAMVLEAKDMIGEYAGQLEGEHYGRVILTSTYPEDSEETRAFLASLSGACSGMLDGPFYLIGISAMNDEMAQRFNTELNRITLITAAAIFAVVAVTFRSLMIPLILVLVVQCGVYLTMTFIGLNGGGIFYMALLFVQCILMGATIDYGILYTTYYREYRKTMDRKGAIEYAYDGALHTILTSSLIMIFATGVLGFVFEIPAIREICRTISKGAVSATVLVVFVLPGILAAADRLIRFRPFRASYATDGGEGG